MLPLSSIPQAQLAASAPTVDITSPQSVGKMVSCKIYANLEKMIVGKSDRKLEYLRGRGEDTVISRY